MKKQSKIIALALSLLLLIVACVGITVSATESESDKSLTIISQNVAYSEKMYLYFAVYSDGVDTEGLVLNVYSSDPDKNADAQLLATVTKHEEVVIPDAANDTSYTCRAFATPGVALKNLATEFYVQAVALDGTKSPVRRYSVVEYLNEMIFTADSAEKIEAYEKILAAGDAAQYLLNYYPNDNKNDFATNYAYVKVTDGIVTGEYRKGTYLIGEEISLTYTGSEDIKSWQLLNRDGEVVAVIAAGKSFTVSESVICVPSTEAPPVRGTGLYSDNANTINYTGTTATALKDAGKFVVGSGSPSFEGSNDENASVVTKDGDSALKISNKTSSGSATYYALKSANGTSSGDYIFETDIYIESATSTRSNKGFLAFGDGKDAGNAANYTPTVIFTVDNGKYQIVVNGTSVATDIACGEWFNFRIEYDDCNTSGAAIRYYVNGTLIGTSKNKGATTAFGFIRVGLLDNSTCEVYLDNTIFMTIK